MRRAKFDQECCESLAQQVRDIEAKTDAEIVIVVRARSGVYRHADYLFGLLLAFAGLIFVLFSPFDFHTYWVPFDVVLLFVIGAFVSSRSSFLRSLLTTKNFRAKAARAGAAAMFFEAGIANTHAENGLLIYLSLLERSLELIADRGILTAVPPLEWNHTLFELKQAGLLAEPESLKMGLKSLGELLAKHKPVTGENPNELPDMPRFELK